MERGDLAIRAASLEDNDWAGERNLSSGIPGSLSGAVLSTLLHHVLNSVVKCMVMCCVV